MSLRRARNVLHAKTRPKRSVAKFALTVTTLLLTLIACTDGGVTPTPVVPPADGGPGGQIAGTVTDEAGHPRAAVPIAIFDALHRPGRSDTGPLAHALTDAEGHYDVRDVAPGRYRVFATLDGRGAMSEHLVRDLATSPSPHAGRALLHLQPHGTVRGSVTDDHGNPVVGATVYLAGSPYATSTDGAGAFTLSDVAVGAYDIGAWADGFHDAAYVEARSLPGVVVDVEGLVLEPSDQPIVDDPIDDEPIDDEPIVDDPIDDDPSDDDPIDDETFDPGAPVGEWVDVTTHLDYRVLGTSEWTPASGFARLHPLGMGRAIHTVELSALEPGTEYEFRLPYDPAVAYPVVLADPTTNMTIHWQTRGALHEFQPRPTTDEWTFRFRTFPDALSDEPVRIAFGGDIKQGAQPYETYELVLSTYTAQDLHALVITGDWVYDDNDPFKDPYWGDNRFADLWDVYKLHGMDSQGRLTPLVPGIGNHEVAEGYRGEPYDWDTQTLGDNTVFAVQFPTVPPGWYFVVDIGGYASVVMLDSEHVNPAIGYSQDRQTPWLQQVLEDRASVPSVLVTYHVAAYPVARPFSGGLPRRIRTSWHPLLDAHDNVKLVFEMHDHVYGESHWIRGGEVVAEGAGIKYLGAGHMGTIQNRGVWNPATTWYLKDAMGRHVKQAESGEEHPDDGMRLDAEGTRTRHVWIVELREDERRVRSYVIDGSERASFTF